MKRLLGMMATVAMLSSPAFGGTLTLSNASSDETDPAVLNAELHFSDPVGDQVQLTITNETTDPNGYQITAVYFNVSSNITGLELQTPLPTGFENWELVAAGPPGNPLQVGPFGRFDYVLQWSGGAGGIDLNALDYPEPDNSVTFTLNITSVDDNPVQSDFIQLSEQSGDNLPAYAAAHFQDGPGGDSAFGAVVIPEASSLLTFAMVGGVFGLVQIRRRRS